MRLRQPAAGWARRQRVVWAILALAGASPAASDGSPPRLCWQVPAADRLARLPPPRGRAGELQVSDGAHSPVWLGGSAPRARTRFSVAGHEPALFLRSPRGTATVWVWALAGDGGLLRLGARLLPAGAGGCAGEPLLRPTFEIEARGSSGPATCRSWPVEEGWLERLVEATRSQGAACIPLPAPPVDLTRVPDLVGQLVSEAVALLPPQRLTAVVLSGGEPAAADKLTDYRVAAQQPAAGSEVEPGSEVTLEAMLTLPDLRGRPLGEVAAMLRRLGLVMKGPGARFLAAGGEVEDLTVALHEPGAGQPVAFGGVVELDAFSAVPDVRRLALAEAGRRLERRGLRLEGGSDVPRAAGRVLAQQPDAGARLPLGAAVRVVGGVGVPSLEGATVAAAEAALAARGLRLGLSGESAERWRREAGGNRLANQQPAAGTLVAAGTAVTAELAIEVPNLRWMRTARAVERLGSSGLVAGRPRPGGAASLSLWVVDQSPAAGGWLPAGGTVNLTLGPGLAPDLAPHRWPWPWLLAVVALYGAKNLFRRKPEGLRVEAHQDAGAPALAAGGRDSGGPSIRVRASWGTPTTHLDTGSSEEEHDG